ncbi:hypothetical protein TNCV_2370491 [Trichonephila clavipes]|nr:hypothetical protein TNCV_2370491 [Trichonephila clavipes]
MTLSNASKLNVFFSVPPDEDAFIMMLHAESKLILKRGCNATPVVTNPPSSQTKYTKASGDGSRNLEPLSSNEDDAYAGTPLSKLLHHTNGRKFEISTDLMCIAPLHGGSSAVLGLELITRRPCVRYLDL